MLEQDFINIFSKYNLYDALRCFSRMSYYIGFNSDEKNINGFAYIDSRNMISQAILAYFTNMILISSSNEHKAKMISKEAQTIFKLASDYSNKLQEFPDDFDGLDPARQFQMILISSYYTQTRLQFDRGWIFARAVFLYEKLLGGCNYEGIIQNGAQGAEKINPVELFKEETGLTIKEYFIFSFLLMSLDPHKELIRSTISFAEDLKKINPEIYNEAKMQKYLELFSCDYQRFKNLDQKINKDYQGLSHLRLNPLNIYPIIKTQKKYLKREPIYLIPNYSLFYLKITEGLFWFFIDYYSRKDKENGVKDGAKKGAEATFRVAFGKAFKEYVGLLLKEIYNDKNESVYDSDGDKAIKVQGKPLGDWYIDLGNKFYIIEVKSRRYNRLAQTLDIEALNKELDNFVENAAQVYDAVKKIKTSNDKALESLKDKRIIPVLINYEVPYLNFNQGLDYETELSSKNPLKEKFKEKNMAKAELYYSDIYGLEIYLDILKEKQANLEDVFHKAAEEKTGAVTALEVNTRESLKLGGSNRFRQGNSFLDGVYKDFWDESLGRKS